MNNNFFLDKFLFQYVLKFLFLFCFFYFGTTVWIGLSTPGGGYHISFIERYLDYISLLRLTILSASRCLLLWIGYPTDLVGKYNLKLVGGHGIHMVYSCLGYGVMSFWTAFIIANRGSFKKKLLWGICGLFTLWVINVVRISLLVLARNNKTNIFHSISHHTMFNIVAYLLIFLMIYLFDRFSVEKEVIDNKTIS